MRSLALLLPLSVLIPAALFAADEDYNANSAQNQRPMLGVEMSPVTSAIQDREGIDAHTGVQVQSTYSGTAAEAMGIKKDDVILGINGQPISSMTDLRNEVGLTVPGDRVEVQVSRNGQLVIMASDVKPWPDQIPYEKLDAAAEKRFRDWQDRRQQRLADEVARADREAERVRRQLSGEADPSAAGSAGRRNDPGLELAFRFSYGIDAARLPAAAAEAVDPAAIAVVADVPAWRADIAIGSSFTTL